MLCLLCAFSHRITPPALFTALEKLYVPLVAVSKLLLLRMSVNALHKYTHKHTHHHCSLFVLRCAAEMCVKQIKMLRASALSRQQRSLSFFYFWASFLCYSLCYGALSAFTHICFCPPTRNADMCECMH